MTLWEGDLGRRMATPLRPTAPTQGREPRDTTAREPWDACFDKHAANAGDMTRLLSHDGLLKGERDREGQWGDMGELHSFILFHARANARSAKGARAVASTKREASVRAGAAFLPRSGPREGPQGVDCVEEVGCLAVGRAVVCQQ